MDFVVRNISYDDNLYRCYDDPNRNGQIRYGWFSNRDIDSECSWANLNYERNVLGAELVDQQVLDSIKLSSMDVSILNGQNKSM